MSLSILSSSEQWKEKVIKYIRVQQCTNYPYHRKVSHAQTTFSFAWEIKRPSASLEQSEKNRILLVIAYCFVAFI